MASLLDWLSGRMDEPMYSVPGGKISRMLIGPRDRLPSLVMVMAYSITSAMVLLKNRLVILPFLATVM